MTEDRAEWRWLDCLTIRSDVNPKDVRINLHARDMTLVPKKVVDGMKQIRSDAKRAMDEQGWVGYPDSVYHVHFFFAVDNYRMDVDGPHKRTQDAIFHPLGINVNDNLIDRVQIDRVVRDQPGIFVIIDQYRQDGGPNKRRRNKRGRSRRNNIILPEGWTMRLGEDAEVQGD